MSTKEINAIRARSKAANDGPWVTDWSEMGRKTVLRRSSKYWPSMDEMDRAFALEEDDAAPGRGLPVEIPKAEVVEPEPEPEPTKAAEPVKESDAPAPAPPREPGDDSDEEIPDGDLFGDAEPEKPRTRTEEVKAKLGVKPRVMA